MRVVQLIDYSYDADETQMVWPPDLSVRAFVGITSSIVDHVIRGSLCDPIRELIKEARDEVMTDLKDFQTALNDLQDSLQSYNKTISNDIPRYRLL
jgi:hypothetical protein